MASLTPLVEYVRFSPIDNSDFLNTEFSKFSSLYFCVGSKKLKHMDSDFELEKGSECSFIGIIEFISCSRGSFGNYFTEH